MDVGFINIIPAARAKRSPRFRFGEAGRKFFLPIVPVEFPHPFEIRQQIPTKDNQLCFYLCILATGLAHPEWNTQHTEAVSVKSQIISSETGNADTRKRHRTPRHGL